MQNENNMADMLTIEEMTEALEQYYEAAGFTDYENRKLKGKTDEEIRQLYCKTFGGNL